MGWVVVLSKERTFEQESELNEWSRLRYGDRALWTEDDIPAARAWYNNALEGQGTVRRPECPQWSGEKVNPEREAEKQADASQGAMVTGAYLF